MLGPVDAEDAWSETFLAALRAYPDLSPDSNVRGWLVTIAHRKAIDGWRAGQRRAVPLAELPEHGAEDTLDESDDRLLAALQALPDKQRMTVAYRYLGDLSYRAIADLLGGTEAAARRSAADGIKALRLSYPEERA